MIDGDYGENEAGYLDAGFEPDPSYKESSYDDDDDYDEATSGKKDLSYQFDSSEEKHIDENHGRPRVSHPNSNKNISGRKEQILRRQTQLQQNRNINDQDTDNTLETDDSEDSNVEQVKVHVPRPNSPSDAPKPEDPEISPLPESNIDTVIKTPIETPIATATPSNPASKSQSDITHAGTNNVPEKDKLRSLDISSVIVDPGWTSTDKVLITAPAAIVDAVITTDASTNADTEVKENLVPSNFPSSIQTAYIEKPTKVSPEIFGAALNSTPVTPVTIAPNVSSPIPAVPITPSSTVNSQSEITALDQDISTSAASLSTGTNLTNKEQAESASSNATAFSPVPDLKKPDSSRNVSQNISAKLTNDTKPENTVESPSNVSDIVLPSASTDIKPKILAQQSLNASEKIVSGSTNETSTNNITTSLDNPPTSPASNAISAVVSSNNMSAAIDTEAPATNLSAIKCDVENELDNCDDLESWKYVFSSDGEACSKSVYRILCPRNCPATCPTLSTPPTAEQYRAVQVAMMKMYLAVVQFMEGFVTVFESNPISR